MNADMIPIFHPGDNVIDEVRLRIHYKMRDYAAYCFSAPQSCAINIFFDLAQEFDDLEHVQLLSVLLLRMFFHYDAELYLQGEGESLELVTPALHPESALAPVFKGKIWQDATRCYIPVRGRTAPMVPRNSHSISHEDLLGVLVIYGNRTFADHDLLFLEKYANRVGFSLHNKILALRNERHVLFLRKLAHDIGHNTTTPNMRMKLMLHQLDSQIATLKKIAQQEPGEALMHELRTLQAKMETHAKEVTNNFTNIALFLESLLRQSHFDLGRYVLRLERLDLVAAVVVPQFQRYRAHFEERDLAVVGPFHPPTPCMVRADLGLLSQVLANYLANAAKYTKVMPARGAFGSRGEVRCEVRREGDAFGPGKAGFCVLVFSSGLPIAEEERAHLFEDNFRASNSLGKYGTGHGLFFVREIIAEHQGKVAYEPAAAGNIFSFTVPAAE